MPPPSGLPSGAAAPSPEERIYTRIADAITDRRLAPGTRLVEEQLADVFGVSRARVRKVLLLLAQARIVSLQRNRGAVVAAPSLREAREVFHARRLIEAEIVRLLTADRQPLPRDALQRLQHHLDLEAAAREAGDRPAAIRLSGEFHQLLAAVAGHGVFEHMLETLIRQSSLVIAVHERATEHTCSTDEHRPIVDALARGNGEEASRLLLDHLASIERRLGLTPAPLPAVDLRRVFADDPAGQHGRPARAANEEAGAPRGPCRGGVL